MTRTQPIGASPAIRASVPRLSEAFVPRDRLSALVEAGVERGLVTVSAPAGSGKTLALAAWASGRSHPVGWLSLEPEDADPQRFWSRVLAALQAVPGLRADETLAGLHPPLRQDARFAAQLVRACQDVSSPPVLVIDEAHQLTGSPALGTLASAVRRGLGRLRLVIAGRADLALPLQRLRLAGELTEVHGADLGFRSGEARELLARHGVRLAQDQLAAVLEKTEGWAAGLRLAALTLEKATDTAAAVAALTGEQRTVADYFVEEVLDDQPEELTEFLLATCVARTVDAELANSLTGREDGQRMLDTLERENLFVVALDDRRGSYRYHHLFGQLLRHRLASLDPARARALHERAAAWFAAHHDPLEAGRHLAWAQEWSGLARSVVHGSGAEMLGHERAVLVDLVRRLPTVRLLEDPEAAAAGAIAAYAALDSDGVAVHAARSRSLLYLLPGAEAAAVEAVLCTVEALTAWRENDTAGLSGSAAAACDRLAGFSRAELPALPTYLLAARIALATGRLWAGRVDDAARLLADLDRDRAASPTTSPVLTAHVQATRALVEALRGEVTAAGRHAQTALDAGEQSGWLSQPPSAMAFVASALVHLERGDREQAREAVQRGHACVGEARDRFVETTLDLVRARLEVLAGDPAAARSSLARLGREQADWPMPAFLRRCAMLVEAEAAVATGAVDQAWLLVAAASTVPGGAETTMQPAPLLLRARMAMLRRSPQEALQALAPWLTQPDDVPLSSVVEAGVLAALAQDRLRQDAAAVSTLRRAVTAAASDGLVRPFLAGDPAVAALLRRVQRTAVTPGGYAADLLQRLEPAGAQPVAAVQPLTSREQSVLMLLPTMMSNTEIAVELFVSVNTVKVHLKALYRKLGVTNRRQAVARGRELGLLDSPLSPVPA